LVTTIFSALFVLGVLVFFHELGHFAIAKLSGIKVEKFSLGFPPTAVSKKWGETEYCLSWVPLGGYVKMAGDDPSKDEITGAPDEFLSKPARTKIAVVAAGPIMNFILALFLFWGIFYFSGKTVINTTRIQISEPRSGLAEILPFENGDSITSINGIHVENWKNVNEQIALSAGENIKIEIFRGEEKKIFQTDESIIDELQNGELGIYPLITTEIDYIDEKGPIAAAGLIEGDVIVSINGQTVNSFYDLRKIILDLPDDSLNIVYVRGNEEKTALVISEAKEIPTEDGSAKTIGYIGIMGKLPYKTISLGLIGSLAEAGIQTKATIVQMVSFLKKLVTGKISTKYMGGPIYIFQLSGKMAQAGWESLLSFMALISLNLGLVNLLPIPLLDGGHILTFLIEGIFRRKLTEKQQSVIQYIGLTFIGLLTVLVLYNDIVRLLK